jgi:hypothetical protein
VCKLLHLQRQNMTAVREDQFDVEENTAVHLPTGAEFWAYPGTEQGHCVRWGDAGAVLPNGDDYARDEVAKVALKLLASRSNLKK